MDVHSSSQRKLPVGGANSALPPTIRGDGECASSGAQHRQLHHQHQPEQPDKWSCPCGGSCSDELSRLESRLAVMETRLADFEVMLKSCRSLSLSGGDAGGHWPDSSLATGGGVSGGGVSGGAVSGGGVSGGIGGYGGNAIGFKELPPADTAEAASRAAPTEPSGPTAVTPCEGTALNLVLTEDSSSRGSSASTTWTDLGERMASQPADWQRQQLQLLQQQPLESDQELQEHEPVSCTESFDVVRYSTQETFVHQQQHDLRSYSSGCQDLTPLSSAAATATATAAAADCVDDGATVSTGEQTTASVSRDAAVGRNRSLNFSSSSSGGRSPDCRLCGDLESYTRRRLRDLARDGVAPGGCVHRGPTTMATSATMRRRKGGGGTDVCIQRSGFSKVDTVLIAGLVLKAAAMHQSEGDQASFVRLALRKMGFECAVIIGRHFTGCICGLDSSRLLLDFGEKSCLIFSFFQLTSSLTQLSHP